MGVLQLANQILEFIQTIQNKTSRNIADVPWHVSNVNIHKDLNMPSVTFEIHSFCQSYFNKLECHPHYLAPNLLDNSPHVGNTKNTTL